MNSKNGQKQLSDDEIMLLLTLRILGGKGARYRVLNEIGRGALTALLPKGDLDELKSGNRTRYEANISWASDHLKKKGYLRSFERGIWELTDEGRRKIEDWLALTQQK